jgi:signal peptidase I
MADLSYPKPTLYKRDGGILLLSGPALLDMLRAVLDKRVSIRFTAPGFSMSPFIKDSDVITVSQIGTNAIRLGDAVAFVNPCNERLAVHRVVGIKKEALLIKGDNTPEPDGWIPSTQVLGRVTCLERANRRVRFGFGFESVVIAFLSRCGWLAPLMVLLRYIYRFLFKRKLP